MSKHTISILLLIIVMLMGTIGFVAYEYHKIRIEKAVYQGLRMCAKPSGFNV